MSTLHNWARPVGQTIPHEVMQVLFALMWKLEQPELIGIRVTRYEPATKYQPEDELIVAEINKAKGY